MTGQIRLLSQPLPDASLTKGHTEQHREQYCTLKPASNMAGFHSVGGKKTGECHWGVKLTRRQCLITAATSSWLSSFFAMSSTCIRVSGRGSGLLSLTPARVSLGEVKSWKGRPRSLSKELVQTEINKHLRMAWDTYTHTKIRFHLTNPEMSMQKVPKSFYVWCLSVPTPSHHQWPKLM